MIRKIIQIDEEKCNGCGACANACHEGAIQMIDGKARLIRDDYCDGLGDCLPACPTDAIHFIEREAAAYDDDAVKEHLKKKGFAVEEIRVGSETLLKIGNIYYRIFPMTKTAYKVPIQGVNLVPAYWQ